MPCPANELGNGWPSSATERRTILYDIDLLALSPTRANMLMMEKSAQKSKTARSKGARGNSPRRSGGLLSFVSPVFSIFRKSTRHCGRVDFAVSHCKQRLGTQSTRHTLGGGTFRRSIAILVAAGLTLAPVSAPAQQQAAPAPAPAQQQ